MRFGICTNVEHLALLDRVGSDYIELPMAPALRPEEPAEDVMTQLEAFFRTSRLRAETFNLLLPSDLRVVGEDLDVPRQVRYLDSAFGRAAMLGGEVVVFGSGGARRIPEGFPPGEARRQIVSFLKRAGDAAVRHGLLVAIEPLNRAECNHIVSVAEAVSLAQEVQHRGVGVLADLYHITQEGESLAATRNAGSLLQHVHVAGAQDRRAPIRDDKEFLKPFFRALQESGYDGRVSVEGRWTDIAGQAEEALDTLRLAWAEAQHDT